MCPTVCPPRGPGSIPGHGDVSQEIFSWLITFCQLVHVVLTNKLTGGPWFIVRWVVCAWTARSNLNWTKNKSILGSIFLLFSAIVYPLLNFGLPFHCPQAVRCNGGEIEPFFATLAQDRLAECDQVGKNPLKYSAMAGNWTRATGRTVSEIHLVSRLSYCDYLSLMGLNDIDIPNNQYGVSVPVVSAPHHTGLAYCSILG